MRYFIPLVLGGVLLGSAWLPARDVRDNPKALVTSWYQQYLGREPDPQGLGHWIGLLRQRQSPALVLSGILGSDEYYQRVGNNPEEFIHALFLASAGREPSPGEMGFWVNRMNVQQRYEIVFALLQKFGVPQLEKARPRPKRERIDEP